MQNPSYEVEEAARLWALRVQDPSFADWDRLSEWLESDPAHLPAYDAALDTDAWAADLFAVALSRAPALTAPVRSPARGRWFIASSAVAAAVLAIGSWSVFHHDMDPRVIATGAAEHRTVDLADGSRVVLNGGTTIRLDPKAPRQVAITDGEALFEIKHDSQDPFVVIADGTRLIDVGTVFNVVRRGEAIDVAVAEGAVDYDAGSRRIRLNSGTGLSRANGLAKPVLRKMNPESVGSWQVGQLQYDDASLDQVAIDLARNTGRGIRVEAGAERLRFTGTLILQGSPKQVFARAGPLLGVRFVEDGDDWTMVPASAGPP